MVALQCSSTREASVRPKDKIMVSKVGVQCCVQVAHVGVGVRRQVHCKGCAGRDHVWRVSWLLQNSLQALHRSKGKSKGDEQDMLPSCDSSCFPEVIC